MNKQILALAAVASLWNISAAFAQEASPSACEVFLDELREKAAQDIVSEAFLKKYGGTPLCTASTLDAEHPLNDEAAPMRILMAFSKACGNEYRQDKEALFTQANDRDALVVLVEKELNAVNHCEAHAPVSEENEPSCGLEVRPSVSLEEVQDGIATKLNLLNLSK